MNYFAIEYGWTDKQGDHKRMLSQAKIEKDGYVDFSITSRERDVLLFEKENDCDSVIAAMQKMRANEIVKKVPVMVNPLWQGKLNLYKA